MIQEEVVTMSTYVIGDIHGEYDQLKILLEKMNFCDEDELYIMGDIVDRGAHPIKALQYLMTIPNCICLIGNHEVMALKCLKLLKNEITEEFISSINEDDVLYLLDWMRNGAKSTMDEFQKLTREEQNDIIDFLGDFEAYAELTINGQDYILVHAGLGNDFCYLTPMDEYSLDDLVWYRTDYEIPYYEDKIVITGHTPTQHIPGNPRPGYIFRGNNHIALDCCACSPGGRLAGICLETGEEFFARE